MHPGAKQLRLWPGIAAVVLQWLLRFGLPSLNADWMIAGMAAEVAGAAAILVWWLFFSRASWLERIGVPVLLAAVVPALRPLLDKSLQRAGMGMLFYIYAIPVMCMALVVWAVATRAQPGRWRLAGLAAVVLLACASFVVLRTEGVTGDGFSQFAFRWSASAEQMLIAHAPVPTPPLAAPEPAPAPKQPEAELPKATPIPPAADLSPHADWPGFRGPLRDGVVRGVRIGTDWRAHGPKEIWRRKVGPAWSSFAVHDGLIYTQEQRGDSELVTCYRQSSGEPVWTHKDAARFWESEGGAGPRATPTLSGGLVYSFGATGILNALDARTGAVVWSHNVAGETGAKIPAWGFSASPLVHGDLVIVAASSRLAAYDAANGQPRWQQPTGKGSYSSPHLLTFEGVPQIVMLSDEGASGIAPADGKVLWKHSWPGATILQPVLAPGGMLITTGSTSGGAGTRRLAVALSGDAWTVDEKWTSTGLKPFFNDLVVHKDHAFGFDGAILSCIDLQTGARAWKGGRYGHGQMLLVADQDLLLVLSEEGDVALVEASPASFRELGRMKALDGKTWNHPVLAGPVLLVRNGEEMAAFRLD